MRRPDSPTLDPDSMSVAPFLLLPSPFPGAEFRRAASVQTSLNRLMHRVAHDRKFLSDTLSATVAVDDFTGGLFKIFVKVWDEGLAQVRGPAVLKKKYGHLLIVLPTLFLFLCRHYRKIHFNFF